MAQKWSKLVISFGLFFWYPFTIFATTGNPYPTIDRINYDLKNLASKFPQIVTYHTLGYSQENREISFVVITKAFENAPAIFLNATHHGDEKASTQASLGLINFLLKNRTSAQINQLLRRYRIYVLPVINPDGYVHNSRYDVKGRDPNRDYATHNKRNAPAFQIPEIRLVRNLMDKLHFKAAIAYHSGMRAILWPSGFNPKPNADHKIFFELSKKSAQALGTQNYKQSYYDYPTQGEFIDYAYEKYKTLAITMEVATRYAPPKEQLDRVVSDSVSASIAFLKGFALLRPEFHRIAASLQLASID